MNSRAEFSVRATRRLGVVCVLLGSASCATTHRYTHKNIPNRVELRDSTAHSFEYVNVTADDQKLVVYGKIRHSHLVCESTGHVDLSLVSPGGDTAYFVSIPIVRRSRRARGWHGAAFRARLDVEVPRDHVVRLAFHGERCVTDQVYDCRTDGLLPAAGLAGR